MLPEVGYHLTFIVGYPMVTCHRLGLEILHDWNVHGEYEYVEGEVLYYIHKSTTLRLFGRGTWDLATVRLS